MGKIAKKIKKKLPGQPEHLTEKEKLEERREEVLSKGRKFKYPMQFAKHRMVFITIAIAFIALIIAGVLGWTALYKTQSTGDLLYRLTTIIPVPVASIDGENVRYSDYLMIYRSSITPVEQQNGTFSNKESDSETFRNFYKRTALTQAEDYTYALKLDKQLGLTITDEQINKEFDEHRNFGGTERSRESFLKVVKESFGLTEREYRRMLYLSLVKVEVSKKIDTVATETAYKAHERVLAGDDFQKVAEELGIEYSATGELADVKNVDGGRSTKAYNMEPGQISDVFVSENGDCYYIIKLLEKNDTQVNYVSLSIPFTEFDNRLKVVREENRVEEFITFDEEKNDSAIEAPKTDQ